MTQCAVLTQCPHAPSASDGVPHAALQVTERRMPRSMSASIRDACIARTNTRIGSGLAQYRIALPLGGSRPGGLWHSPPGWQEHST
jgi:hypothetical protein